MGKYSKILNQGKYSKLLASVPQDENVITPEQELQRDPNWNPSQQSNTPNFALYGKLPKRPNTFAQNILERAKPSLGNPDMDFKRHFNSTVSPNSGADFISGIEGLGLDVANSAMLPVTGYNAALKGLTGFDAMGSVMTPIDQAMRGWEGGFNRLGNTMFGTSDKDNMQNEFYAQNNIRAIANASNKDATMVRNLTDRNTGIGINPNGEEFVLTPPDMTPQ